MYPSVFILESGKVLTLALQRLHLLTNQCFDVMNLRCTSTVLAERYHHRKLQSRLKWYLEVFLRRHSELINVLEPVKISFYPNHMLLFLEKKILKLISLMRSGDH